ncbi:hypothetical protein SteCoe_22987 [Stentor coeruleus]|uniref:EGF-like domain-containing protein n=1 Tax=Stentor coeruleus TaxID=5963 RepID=A0A1R2BKW3_9CILI|nr:hypothetical protein SteCoe_22987 [Stentor coeruleus]
MIPTLLLILVAESSVLVEYRFADNFGQVFHDYSGNNYHAVNGDSYLTTSKDTTPTDRGAYFDQVGADIITLPSNDKVSTQLNLPSTFTIMLWANSYDDWDYFILYRKNSDGSNYFYLKRIDTNNILACKIKSGTYTSTETKSAIESYKESIFYLDFWNLITLIISGTTVKANTNGINRITITISSTANEWIEGTNSYSMTIGHTDTSVKSMEAVLWKFTIFDTEVSDSDYYGGSYTPGNCLVASCPSSCNPSIKIGTNYYCMSVNKQSTQLGTGTSCSSTCTNSNVGCFTSASNCLTCSCSYYSCIISGSSTVCWCPTDAVSTSTGCTCNNGGTYDGISTCVCYTDCSACTVALLCTSCIASNASPTTTIGYKCNDKYYNTTALTTSGACLSCYSHCATCSQANICLACIANNASPTASQGCACDNKYYLSGDLTSSNACSACHIHCATCNQASICLTCISANASPTSIGCACNNKYYLNGDLISSNACNACHSHCITCNQANICLACIAANASPTSIGCACDNKYYLTGDLTSSNACTACHSHCAECDQGSKCLTCIAQYANPSTIGCECKIKYYLSTSLTDINGCVSCNSQCASCIQADTCSTCITVNAEPNSIGCSCKSKYYLSGSLESIDGCTLCYDHCATCNQADICQECITINAEVASVGCQCKSGYYLAGALTEIDGCSQCYNQCKTCEKSDVCLTCITDNASPSPSSYGCVCNSMYYLSGALTAVNGCSPCHSHCLSCVEANKCIDCKALNSSPSIIGCSCNPNTYSSNTLDKIDGCTLCHEHCASCNETDICITCIYNNTVPSIIGCTCNEGFYLSGILNSSSSCLSCHSDCYTCEEADKCLLCIDENSIPDTIGCTCINGYYISSIDPLRCSACLDQCKTCTNSFNCTSCKISNAIIVSGSCQCPDNSIEINNSCVCNDGFFLIKESNNENVCLECNKKCKTCCYNGNNSYCLSCFNSTDILTDTGDCISACLNGYYDENGICKVCPELCNSCNSIECFSCVLNADLTNVDRKKCYCKEGFKQSNNNCLEDYFEAVISVDNNNKIKVEFEEEIKVDLSVEDILVSIQNVQKFSYSVSKNDFKTFYVTLNFFEDVYEGTIVNVTLIDYPIFSKNGKVLKDYAYIVKINYYLVTSKMIAAMANSTSTASKFVITSSITMAIMTNPSAVWILLNTIQMVQYMLLSDNQIPEGLETFISGFGNFDNFIPNPFLYIFDLNSTSMPCMQVKDFGYSTSVFFINIGISIAQFCIILSFLPLLYILSKFDLGKISLKINKLLSNYKYSFFLRFWSQAYLDIGIAAIIQLRSVIIIKEITIPGYGHFNYFSAALCAILFIVTPLCFIIASYLFRSDIFSEENEEFISKWGCYYFEFKNNKGFMSCQYYFIYFLRRLGFSLSQIYLNSYPHIQGGLNILGSLIQTGYLFYFRPFKERSILLSNMIGEICVTVTMGLVYSLMFIKSLKTVAYIEKSTIFVILSGMVIEIIISIYITLESFATLLKNVIKSKKLASLKSARVNAETKYTLENDLK